MIFALGQLFHGFINPLLALKRLPFRRFSLLRQERRVVPERYLCIETTFDLCR